MIVVVMGVSGAGKSSIGRALADALGWPFVEGDDLHPAANVAKMHRGQPLDDDDRAPWLAAVADRMRALTDGVVACSALRASYRDRLRVRADVRFVLLDVAPDVLAERMSRRRGHYMPASLLPSQLAALERTADVLVVDGGEAIPDVVAAIRARLGL